METPFKPKITSKIPKAPNLTKKINNSSKISSTNSITKKKKKTPKPPLVKKYESMLTDFIKKNKNEVQFSGNKRFSNKSGEYYLKNKKEIVNENLAPIPTMNEKQNRNKYENKAIANAERIAVSMRRMQYSLGIKASIENDKFIQFKLNNIVKIQNWWKLIFKIITIQKNIKGFLYRKKLMAHLIHQGNVINGLVIVDEVYRRIIGKKVFKEMKKLLTEKRNIFLLRKFVKKIDKFSKISQVKFELWKKKTKHIKSVLRTLSLIMKNFISLVIKSNKKKVFKQLKKASIRSKKSIIGRNYCSGMEKLNSPKRKKISTTSVISRYTSEGPLQTHREQYLNENINQTQTIVDEILTEINDDIPTKTHTSLTFRRNKKGKVRVYDNQLHQLKSKISILKVHSSQIKKNCFDALINQINAIPKKTKRKKMNFRLRIFFDKWRNMVQEKLIRKSNSAANLIYSNKKFFDKRVFKSSMTSNENINERLLLNIAFTYWKNEFLTHLPINLNKKNIFLIISQIKNGKRGGNQKDKQYILKRIMMDIKKLKLKQYFALWKKKKKYQKKILTSFNSFKIMRQSQSSSDLNVIFHKKKVVSQNFNTINNEINFNLITIQDPIPEVQNAKFIYSPIHKFKTMKQVYNESSKKSEVASEYGENEFPLNCNTSTTTTMTNNTYLDNSFLDTSKIKTKYISFKKKKIGN